MALASRSASVTIPYRFADERCVSQGAPMDVQPGKPRTMALVESRRAVASLCSG